MAGSPSAISPYRLNAKRTLKSDWRHGLEVDPHERDVRSPRPDDYTASSNTVSTTLATPLIDKLDPIVTATIGETITYDICVTLPEGQTQDLVVTDAIPAGLAVQNYSILSTANGVCPGAAAAYNGDADSVAVTSVPAALPAADGVDLALSLLPSPQADNASGVFFLVRSCESSECDCSGKATHLRYCFADVHRPERRHNPA
jgi:uncharacterized repeat protein (TIGR01451 family)